MNSIASLRQLPRGLAALRAHQERIIEMENALIVLHEIANERIARLAPVEDELQRRYLFPAVERFGDDFDGWWRDLPAERVAEVYEYLDTLAGRPLRRDEAEHAAWSAYMDAFHIQEASRRELEDPR
jgi:hypothetical protein